jgi:hypothetical protein
MEVEVGGEAAAVDTTAQAAVEAAVSSQEQAPARNFEAEAKEFGWVPKEEFKGDPAKWRDAEEFVKWGEEFLPFVRADNKKLRKEIEEIKKANTDEIQRMSKLFDGQKKRIEAEFQERLASLQEKREAAVASGNVAEFKRLDGKIDQLKADAVEEVKGSKPETNDADVEAAWKAKNTWYDPVANPDMYDVATGYSQRLAAANPGITMADNLAKVDAYMKEKFPEKFGVKKPAANGHAAVDGGSDFPTAGGNRAKGWDDLPSDAKAAGEKFVRDGTFKDKAAYARAYFEEN